MNRRTLFKSIAAVAVSLNLATSHARVKILPAESVPDLMNPRPERLWLFSGTMPSGPNEPHDSVLLAECELIKHDDRHGYHGSGVVLVSGKYDWLLIQADAGYLVLPGEQLKMSSRCLTTAARLEITHFNLQRA